MRRSLSHVGGPCTLFGEPELAKRLEFCLNVRPAQKLPLTHGFHAYPARMHPEIARRALQRFRPRGRVLDPFVGSGTTALEALRAGLPFAGCDVSRVALEIAWARTHIWPRDEARRIEREGHRIAKEAQPVEPAGWPDAEWFDPGTLAEIAGLKELIDASDLRRILLVVLSSLLVKLSRQVSDSVAAPDPDSRPRPPGTALRFFADKCSELTKNLLLLGSELHKGGLPARDPGLRLADARTVDFAPTADDLVLTSPPYPGTYDYAHHHRLRFPLFGDDGATFADAHEIGARRTFEPRRYRDDLRACLERLRPARALLLIGDDRGVPAERLVRDIAKVAAFASQWRLNNKREHLILLAGNPPAPRPVKAP